MYEGLIDGYMIDLRNREDSDMWITKSLIGLRYMGSMSGVL